MKKPKVLVLRTDGTNCDEETAFAFEKEGAEAKLVHINDLRTKKDSLQKYHILALPGGFSYGDDVVSGKILATELTSFFANDLKKFVERRDTFTIGICNGFQVLIRTGLLPFGKVGTMDATLTNNDSGRFECRWIKLRVESNSVCYALKKIESEIVAYQVAHGEGKFFASDDVIKQIEESKLTVFRYVNGENMPTQEYPANPNGSTNAIAGICDPTGRILGLMPHPERFVSIEQYPNWRREKIEKPQGLPIFKQIVSFVKNA